VAAIRSMLSAEAAGRRVAIGHEPLGRLRALSDARSLACPLCRAPVILRAGPVVSAHFAHLPGARCTHPLAEPESEVHRAGKRALFEWACAVLPACRVLVEADLPTGQRADVLVETPEGDRAVLEYQCAGLGARAWHRRHRLYRDAGLRDLWILGPDRLHHQEGFLIPAGLERALLRARAPLLFLDPLGSRFSAGSLVRFRPRGTATGFRVRGSLSVRALSELAFPWHLLDWPPGEAGEDGRPAGFCGARPGSAEPEECGAELERWLRCRHGVAAEALHPLFGLPARDAESIGCPARLWQAAVYYRFVHGRAGGRWWPGEVEAWARRYLPVRVVEGPHLVRALRGWQDLLTAAGLLGVPAPGGTARIEADLETLGRALDPAVVQRVAAYRRTLLREPGA